MPQNNQTIRDVLEEMKGVCDECEHPVCQSTMKSALRQIKKIIEEAYDSCPSVDKRKVGNEYNDGYDAGVEAMRANLNKVMGE